MKTLLTTVTFLSIIATPALAQSFDPDMGTGNIAFNQQGENVLAQAPGIYEAEHARAEAVRPMYPAVHKSGHKLKRVQNH